MRRVALSVAAMVGLSVLGAPNAAQAQAEPYLGQLMLVGFGYCPRGWTEAAGQILGISQNSALFALYGTTFGGNGQTTFALPDLRSRIPIGQGQGNGLSPYQMGQVGGSEQVTLLAQQMPAHTHTAQSTLNGTETDANATAPGGALLGSGTTKIYTTGGNPDLPLAATSVQTTIGPAGGNQPVGILNPYLGMRWCVAIEGIFPSRP